MKIKGVDADILKKIIRYCSYQERCRQEVKEKLAQIGVPLENQSQYMHYLEEQGYLNEERFIRIFVQSKHSRLGWGKRKIIESLRQKGVMVDTLEIEENNYLEQARKVAEKKSKALKKDDAQKRLKIKRYLYGKGYNADTIERVLTEIK